MTKVKAELVEINDTKRSEKYPGATLLLQWVRDVIRECEILEVVLSKEAEVNRLQKQLDQET